MFKRFLRGILICLSVFTATILIFFMGYKIAYRKSADMIYNSFPAAEQTASAQAETSLTDKDIISPDYFIARYDGTSLSVYSVSGGKEEFLYTLKVRIEDISDQELTELKRGITLPTKQALVSFEEDFTS